MHSGTVPPLPFRPMPDVVPWNHPLQQAIWRGNDDEALKLIAARRFIRAKDCEGITSLHWACQWRRLAPAKALLAAGADPNARCICGSTPLGAAVIAQSPELITLLLDHGADPNLPGVYHLTAFHSLAFLSDRERALQIAEILIRAGADVRVIDTEEHAEAIDFVEMHGHLGFTESLIERGILRGFW